MSDERIEHSASNEGSVERVGRAEAGFVSHARVVAGLTLVSRVAGVARDAVCSRVFGAGPVWSAFALAFLIPNLFRRLFGEGALSAAFLPDYTRLADDDPEAARRFAGLVVGGTALLLGAITLIGELLLLFALMSIGEGGGDPSSTVPLAESRRLVVTLSMIMLPYMPLICLVALLGAMLQAHRRFGPTAAAPIILNLCIIAAALVTAWQTSDAAAPLDERLRDGAVMVSIAVVLAGMAQVAWSITALARAGAVRSAAMSGFRDHETRRRARRMGRMLVPMLLGLGVLQFNTLIDGLIASYPVWAGSTIFGLDYPLDMKSNSVLFFTQRLYQFPLGVFGIAVATAIFPEFSRAAARGREAFSETLRHGIRLTMFIGLPASIGLLLVREPLATVILRGRAFDEEDVARVAGVLFGYAPAIWAYSLNQVLTRAFYANADSRTPVRIALGVVGLNITLNCILIWFLGEAGLAWSTSICATLQAALLLGAIRRYAEQPLDREVRLLIMRTVIISAAMIPLVFALMGVARLILGSESWVSNCVQLFAAVVGGALTCLIAARVLGMPEAGWLLQRRTD